MKHLNASDANTQNIVQEKKYFQEDVQSVVMTKALRLEQCLTSVNFLY